MNSQIPDQNIRITCRAWFYTIYNCQLDLSNESRVRYFFEQVDSLVSDGRIRYACGQVERCPSSGRLHIQLYVLFNQSCRINRLKQLLGLPDGYGWAQPRRGTHDGAVKYCTKEDTRVIGPFECGRVALEQGKRSDLDTGVEVLKAGGLKRVAEECPSLLVKYPRGFLELASRVNKPPMQFHAKKVSVLFGGTNLGKTRWAMEYHPGFFEVPQTSESTYWFHGYDGEEVILLDEYGCDKTSRLPYTFLLKLLDGRPIQVPTKGGFVWIPGGIHIIITSNHPPQAWYPDQDYRPLERRITTILHFTAPKTYRVLKDQRTVVKAPEEVSLLGISSTPDSQLITSLGGGQQAPPTEPATATEDQEEMTLGDINLEIEKLLSNEEL